MAHVTRSLELAASPEDVWGLIGGFQALPDWHPAVQGSAQEMQDGAELRRLDLGGGAEILEKSLGGDGMSYGYEILEVGPLPIANYRATIGVAPCAKGCMVTWSSNFDAAGAPEPDAKGAVSGIYEAGFAALTEKFGG
ncbi:MAG: SRPBCC family protein [Rhodobacteraceae bacterium]|nr:SRPBCC family protein [Paracoccaceae bacterium]